VQLNTTPTALFKEMPAAKKVVGTEKPSVVSGPRARQGGLLYDDASFHLTSLPPPVLTTPPSLRNGRYW
jgi:hypothetical protein